MSIIDIEKSKNITNNSGISKKIDNNALSLILDNVQIAQYVYPEQSIVRELTSNAIDSQKEKIKAIDILTGNKKVDDYYIKRDDPKYKDSNFNTDYYNLNNLNKVINHVELEYVSGKEGMGWCDKFIVTDHGVGLGDNRLYGYFQIGYSTKRNSVDELGGFGLGAKVGLSLRGDYFTTETVHNNRRFKFNSYSYKVDSLIPQFDLTTGKENPFIEFPDGDKKKKVYYEETNDLNYTKITIPCKSHHKEKFIYAVQSQLLYFDNVKFYITDKFGEKDNVDIQAKIIYNSDNLIISEQDQYSKPHIVVVKDKKSTTGVTYGYCNFKEMEMQDLFGAVGFKCPIRQVVKNENGVEKVIQEGIEVTPSRESVIWSDITRDYVKNIIQSANKEASLIIQNELKEKDFIAWLKKANSVLSTTNNRGSLLKELSKIIDTSSLNPVFDGDPDVRYGNFKDLFWGFNVVAIDANPYKKNTVNRIDGNFNILSSRNIYLLNEDSIHSLRKDLFLRSFVSIKPISRSSIFENCDFSDKSLVDLLEGKIKKRDKILELIKKSSLFSLYEDVVVPDTFSKDIDDEGKDKKIIRKLPKQLRDENKEVLITRVIKHNGNEPLRESKSSIKISNLKDLPNTYYSELSDDKRLSEIATILMWKRFTNNNTYNSLDHNYINFIKIPSNFSKKLLTNHKHINKFFYVETDSSKGTSKELVEWYTAKIISDNIKDLKFMENFKSFNSEIYDLYKEVRDYSNLWYNKNVGAFINMYKNGDSFTSFLSYIEKVKEFQLFLREDHEDKDSIINKSKNIFGIDSINQAVGINLEMYDKLQVLLNYAEPVKDLLNHIDILVDSRSTIEHTTELLIKDYLNYKKLSDFVCFIPKEENEEIKDLEIENSEDSENSENSEDLKDKEILGDD